MAEKLARSSTVPGRSQVLVTVPRWTAMALNWPLSTLRERMLALIETEVYLRISGYLAQNRPRVRHDSFSTARFWPPVFLVRDSIAAKSQDASCGNCVPDHPYE